VSTRREASSLRRRPTIQHVEKQSALVDAIERRSEVVLVFELVRLLTRFARGVAEQLERVRLVPDVLVVGHFLRVSVIVSVRLLGLVVRASLLLLLRKRLSLFPNF
jgi:hypothetical protein